MKGSGETTTEGSGTAPRSARSKRIPLMRRRKWRFVLIILFALAALTEIGSRMLWSLGNKNSHFFSRDTVLHTYYPGLAKRALSKLRKHADKNFDILLLGGSVLTDSWTDVNSAIIRSLPSVDGREFRIHNLARSGHTSRDSLLKYRLLDPHQFDLVVIYHGINEARTNNCPPDMFRDDYSHMEWYAEVNSVVSNRPASSYLTLLDSLHHLAVKIRGKINPKAYLPDVGILPDYVKFGAEIHSRAAFKSNLREILNLARERGDPVALVTFATFVPQDYSRQAFEAKELDYAYGKRHVAIELWGTPANVQAAVREHNEALGELHAEERSDFFVDMAKLLPQEGQYFSDICHLSDTGSARFADVLLEAVGLSERRSGREHPVEDHLSGDGPEHVDHRR
jgi:hypothetical protein